MDETTSPALPTSRGDTFDEVVLNAKHDVFVPQRQSRHVSRASCDEQSFFLCMFQPCSGSGKSCPCAHDAGAR